MPTQIEVESSWIKAIGYFEEESAMEIYLLNGKTYAYFGVDKSVFEAMLEAESKGRFYCERVKGLYNSLRVA